MRSRSILAMLIHGALSGGVLLGATPIVAQQLRPGGRITYEWLGRGSSAFVYEGNGLYRNEATGGSYRVNDAGQLVQRSDGMRFSPHEGQHPPSGTFVVGEQWTHEYEATKGSDTTSLKRDCRVSAINPYSSGNFVVPSAATIHCTVSTVVSVWSSTSSVSRTHIEVRAPKDFSAFPLEAHISWPPSGQHPGGDSKFRTTAITRAAP